MKIFQLTWGDGEREYISANTNVDAIKVYCQDCSFDVWDFEDDCEINEIPEDEWEKFTIKMDDFEGDEDSKIITFVEWMKQNLESGYICGTMY